MKNKHLFPNFDKKYNRIIESISQKVKDNYLVITKADKGNCVVVLNKLDYVTKVETFLNENNFIRLYLFIPVWICSLLMTKNTT